MVALIQESNQNQARIELIIGTEVVNEDSLRLGGFDFEEIKEMNIVSKY